MAEGLEGCFGGDDNDNEVESDTSVEIRCLKLHLEENIAAYLEKRELLRDTEPVTCDNSTVEKVTANYVIAKKIIGNLCWQDKLLCKHVCSMWHSAVHALKREQLRPVDFVINLHMPAISGGIKYKKSGSFYTEPLVVLTFANTLGFTVTSKCEVILPSPCTPTCEKEHCLIDVVHRHGSAPKECMMAVRASYVAYMPLPGSLTCDNTLTHQMFVRSSPFICGVYIPAMPDVKFDVININTTSDMQSQFFDIVDKLAENRIIKGVLVYVTENYLLQSVEDIVFLNYFKDIQPNVPYALGGCIVEDTIFDQKDINLIVDGANSGVDSFSGNLISIGLFTVPKSTDDIQKEHPYNFDMYSLILESSDWAKTKIQQIINEFSKKVPQFEHSVVIKLSCVGRDQRHELEQDYFRAAFPNTRLVGCYGDGELGVNHPARPPPDDPPSVKRHRRDPGPQYGIMYSYSTVFVYIGWGKILVPAESQADNHRR